MSSPTGRKGIRALWLVAAIALGAGACDDGAAAPSANPATGSLDGQLSAISVFGGSAASALYYLRLADRTSPVRIVFDDDPNLA